MSLDPAIIGTESPGASLLVSRSRLRAFARATGQSDPVYVDVDAARRAGHRDLPAPPTFVFSVDLEATDPFAFVDELGIDMRAVLHGEQDFQYQSMVFAGDELSTTSRVVDVYSKKGGLLDFLVREITVVNQDGTVVATMRNSLVVQNRAPEGVPA